MSNYENAKALADKTDERIIEVLRSGKSFKVEAGAGSGKTYSLMRVIEWLQSNKNTELAFKKQKIACITYTNAAVDVIKGRLVSESTIIPCTIHSFAWDNINRFQAAVIKSVETLNLLPSEHKITEIHKVQYSIGVRYIDNDCLYLYHDDVIKIFVYLLDNAKFRKLLADRYPIILIDEYQDSFKTIIDKFVNWYIDKATGPQFGLFGDAWQTIYASNGACGAVIHENLVEIPKVSNFRSQGVIVDVLNRIRPELKQITALDKNDGNVLVITTNDYSGPRQTGYYSGELPGDVLKEYIDITKSRLQSKYNWTDKTKVLMITHKLLAQQQSYVELLDALGDSFKNGDDPHIKFFKDIVEPLYKALENNKVGELYEVLGISRRPIETKKHKQLWKNIKFDLNELRNKKIIDVLKYVIECKIIPIPPKVLNYYNLYINNPNQEYMKTTLKHFYELGYHQIISAVSFFAENSEFSTDHGVKGEEYDNVLFVVGRGWNNYKFDEILHKKFETLSGKELNNYIRNRNLFYVCCSRPQKNLVLFVSVNANKDFIDYLKNIFGFDNVVSFSEFIKSTS